MIIQSFAVRNYKGFRDKQEVDLAPLTLFYGENSSGKSALLRLLPWVAESMADARQGPRLDGLVAREALWGDLAHVSSPKETIGLRVVWAAGHAATWSLRGGSLPGSCELSRIVLEGPAGAARFDDDGDATWQGKLTAVAGMLPVDGPEFSLGLQLARSDFNLEVQWLQGIRVAVPRVEKALAAAPGVLLPTGEGVARFLYFWDRVARTEADTKALAFVLRFFDRLGFQLRATDVAPGFFRLEVSPSKGAASAVSLVDTGEGLTQVLAPLVALARAAHGLGPRMVAMEQPELHLHTDAQRALALSIAEASAAGAQVLIETHSEVLLAASQLAVASGDIKSSGDVALYWVERRPDVTSLARRVEIDERGRLGGAWPLDAFNDLLQLKGELLQAQRRVK